MAQRESKVDREAARTAARAYLEKYCPPGTKVYCVLRSAARSGMSRVIQLFVVDPSDGRLVRVGHWAARLLDRQFDCDRNGVRSQGAGQDMGFELVYSISSVLYGRNEDGSYSKEGAYSLKHEWL
mgnify:CR=1 FL=1